MRSLSRAAAIAVLVVGAGEFFSQFILRLEIQHATFNDEMYLYVENARDTHVVALLLAVAAFAVALRTGGPPGRHWLGWGPFRRMGNLRVRDRPVRPAHCAAGGDPLRYPVRPCA